MLKVPHHPRTLTPAENAAITAQCIRMVYDEHDRVDTGLPYGKVAECVSR